MCASIDTKVSGWVEVLKSLSFAGTSKVAVKIGANVVERRKLRPRFRRIRRPCFPLNRYPELDVIQCCYSGMR